MFCAHLLVHSKNLCTHTNICIYTYMCVTIENACVKISVKGRRPQQSMLFSPHRKRVEGSAPRYAFVQLGS